MAEDVVDDGLCVLAGAGLEVVMPGVHVCVWREILPRIDYLYLVDPVENHLRTFLG